MICIFTSNVTLPQVLFKHLASKKQLPDLSVSGTLVENGITEFSREVTVVSVVNEFNEMNNFTPPSSFTSPQDGTGLNSCNKVCFKTIVSLVRYYETMVVKGNQNMSANLTCKSLFQNRVSTEEPQSLTSKYFSNFD